MRGHRTISLKLDTACDRLKARAMRQRRQDARHETRSNSTPTTVPALSATPLARGDAAHREPRLDQTMYGDASQLPGGQHHGCLRHCRGAPSTRQATHARRSRSPSGNGATLANGSAGTQPRPGQPPANDRQFGRGASATSAADTANEKGPQSNDCEPSQATGGVRGIRTLDRAFDPILP